MKNKLLVILTVFSFGICENLFAQNRINFEGFKNTKTVVENSNPLLTQINELQFSDSLPNFNVSRDGKYIVLVKDTGIEIIESATGKLKKTVHLRGSYDLESRIGFSPDNKYLLYYDSKALFLFDLEQDKIVFKNPGQDKYIPSFDSQAKLLFVVNPINKNMIDAIEIATGQVKYSKVGPTEPLITHSAVNGFLVIVGAAKRVLDPTPNIFIIDPSNDNIIDTQRTSSPLSVGISLSKNYLFFHPANDIFRTIDISTGNLIQDISTGGADINKSYFSKDSNYLVFSNFNKVTVYDFLQAKEINHFMAAPGDRILDTKLVGHNLFLVTKEGYFRILDIFTGKTIVQSKDDTLYKESSGNQIPWEDFMRMRYSYRFIRVNSAEDRISYFSSIFKKSSFIRTFDIN